MDPGIVDPFWLLRLICGLIVMFVWSQKISLKLHILTFMYYLTISFYIVFDYVIEMSCLLFADILMLIPGSYVMYMLCEASTNMWNLLI